MHRKTSEPHWLDDYGSKQFQWQSIQAHGRTTYYRRLGLVEFCFDADGRYNEGRADINALLELEIRSRLSREELHKRILLAWTCLRCQHLLLQTRAVTRHEISEEVNGPREDICFAVDPQSTSDSAVSEAEKHIVFLDDHFDAVDTLDFWIHSQNVRRIDDPGVALAKLFVLPLAATSDGRSSLRLLITASHQIIDGLTSFVWLRNLMRFLNQPKEELAALLRSLIDPSTLRSRLPLPQEALYPPIAGSAARQRWYWLITRILRHVRRPLVAGFANPLRRRTPLKPVALSPTYAAVLDYSKIPPLNSYPCLFSVSPRNTQRLHRLCREAKVSVGAGCFALAALVAMEMYEMNEPDVALCDRKPFISGFPINPRPFFNHANEPDSLMLSFSDGIALPFLSMDLDLDGRIRLLARQAHRQLATYQKRSGAAGTNAGLQYMSSRGAGRILANQYISSIERCDFLLPEALRRNINPQGEYPARPNANMQTFGVSSVGRRDPSMRRGIYDLEDDTKDLVADFRGIPATVRARDGEFLVGIGGDDDGLGVSISIDGSSIDPALVRQWSHRLEHILERENESGRARL